MYSQLKSLSFMGISNPEMLLSEKDLKLKTLVRRPAELEFEEDKQLQEQEQAKDLKNVKESGGKCKSLVSSLKIKLPSLQEFKINQDQDQDVNDGFKTPAYFSYVLPCPPAPRKPKSQACTKRKFRVLLDLSDEIESLFPPCVLGAKMKKVRQEVDTK